MKLILVVKTWQRELILAINIAETSITIDGIYYVIDPGYIKLDAYDPKVGMDSFKICPISKAQANQRSGRAGRTGPGKCYRLYTEESYEKEMLPNTIPEIQRQNLSHTILMLKAMGINDLINFEFMDLPSTRTLISSLEDLYMLEALGDEGEITTLGRNMADFPMEPALAGTFINQLNLNVQKKNISFADDVDVEPQNLTNPPPRRKTSIVSTKTKRTLSSATKMGFSSSKNSTISTTSDSSFDKDTEYETDDTSSQSSIISTTPSNVYHRQYRKCYPSPDGVRAASAVIRPYMFATKGTLIASEFDIKSVKYSLQLTIDFDYIDHSTTIFIPKWRYPFLKYGDIII
ncbi:hypothetical protein KGF54_000642 [Candida jiufengensis]|uniref:uncharacterized protein n=1 Tax=Candida jiufengensis TaxID=497108 RepID=UPI00222406B1|nr:uncharacterized protein KGF54_000642 [Candida jiufengensis]KAI5956167.1 hypothetical protein KGF54_000642 [Candida jiufengensis]